jgi:hypothetical protein
MTRFHRMVALVLCSAVLWAFAEMAGSAATFNKTTYLKFSGAVALPGVTLSAGEYVFELVNPDTARNVVQVRNRERSKVYLTAITLPVHRPSTAASDATVTLGEAQRGSAPPIKAWFPQGETIGYAFIY